MLRTSNLSYKYPQLDLINFPDITVKASQPLLICGDSGCGKTTLLHLLAGLRTPSGGSIFIGDEELTNKQPAEVDEFRGQQIGIVFQQAYFIESLTVRDNLLVSPFVSSSIDEEAVARRLQIEALLSRYPHQLSSGQQQRASIARAVMNSPKLILADEPTSNLDNKNCSHVIKLLQEEAENNEAALLIVTHDDRLKYEIRDFIDLETIPT